VAPVLLLFLTKPAGMEPPVGVWLWAPLVVIGAVLPVGVVQQLIIHRSGELSLGYLNLCFPIAITLALVGSLIMVSARLRQPRSVASATDVAQTSH
jgi:hypothetical protein